MVDVALRPLFSIFLHVEPGLVIGQVPDGWVRRMTPIDGGTFTGDRLSGRVVSGNDAVTVRPDGTARLSTRCVLETDRQETIYFTYQGIRTVSQQPAAQLTNAPATANESEYFRCVFQFEAASERLSWLNNIVAVGSGRREPEGPWYDVFELT